MNTPGKPIARFIVTIVVGGAFVALSLLVAIILIARREPPPQVIPEETSLAVEVLRMRAEDVPVAIVGHGEAMPIEITPVTAEVSGKVTRIHDRLFVGEIIPAGEVLFEIDPRDYEAAVTQARAQHTQAEKTLERLRAQYGSDRERLATLERNRDLARNEFHRVRDLFEQEAVGALANVERTELAYNQTRDAYDLMAQNIRLYPTRIAEAEQGVTAAAAAQQQAEISLERTRVAVHFDARVQDKRVEKGQYVSPGAPVLTLANDSILEIAVPLDSRDARDALRFAGEDAASDKSWFGAVEQAPCRVLWTEAPDSHYWTGQLDRIMAFDQNTRTVTVAVRVDAAAARSDASPVPLVAGMFCRVEIPGREMQQVYRLPRWAVTFENEVFVVEEGRLMPRKVTVARTQQDQAFIREGLQTDELVIITRLVNPLSGVRVDMEAEEAPVSTEWRLPENARHGEAAL